MTALVSDPEQQQALVEAICDRPDLLFRAAEHAHRKPRQALEVAQQEMKMFIWPDNSDIAEE